MAEDNNPFRLATITLDERSILRRTREIEQERDIAIYDLLESNSFRPQGSQGGPYNLELGIEAIFLDAEFEVVGSALRALGAKAVALEQIVDRDVALLLDLAGAAQDAALVERDGGQTEGVVVLRHASARLVQACRDGAGMGVETFRLGQRDRVRADLGHGARRAGQ